MNITVRELLTIYNELNYLITIDVKDEDFGISFTYECISELKKTSFIDCKVIDFYVEELETKKEIIIKIK